MTPRREIRIRATEVTDVEAIQRLYDEQPVAAMVLQVPYATRHEIEARITSNPDIRRLVAEVEGQVVGDAGLTLYQRRRKHVGSIGMAVSEAFQRQGIGSALLEALLDLADNWYGLRRIELEVYVDNVAAIRLYERFGFQVEGTHRDYAFRAGGLVDAHTMARIVSDPAGPIEGYPAAP